MTSVVAHGSLSVPDVHDEIPVPPSPCADGVNCVDPLDRIVSASWGQPGCFPNLWFHSVADRTSTAGAAIDVDNFNRAVSGAAPNYWGNASSGLPWAHSGTATTLPYVDGARGVMRADQTGQFNDSFNAVLPVRTLPINYTNARFAFDIDTSDSGIVDFGGGATGNGAWSATLYASYIVGGVPVKRAVIDVTNYRAPVGAGSDVEDLGFVVAAHPAGSMKLRDQLEAGSYHIEVERNNATGIVLVTINSIEYEWDAGPSINVAPEISFYPYDVNANKTFEFLVFQLKAGTDDDASVVLEIRPDDLQIWSITGASITSRVPTAAEVYDDGAEGHMRIVSVAGGSTLLSGLALTTDAVTAVELPLDVTFLVRFLEASSGKTYSFALGNAFDPPSGGVPFETEDLPLNAYVSPFDAHVSMEAGGYSPTNDDLDFDQIPADTPCYVRLRLEASRIGRVKIWLASNPEPAAWMLSVPSGPLGYAFIRGDVDDLPAMVSIGQGFMGSGLGVTHELVVDSVSIYSGPDAGAGGVTTGSMTDNKNDAETLTDPAGISTYTADVSAFTLDATDPDEAEDDGDGHQTAWLKIVLTEETDLKFDTIGTDYDTILRLYSGEMPPSNADTAFETNDDGDTAGLQSQIPEDGVSYLTLAAGTYWAFAVPFSTGDVDGSDHSLVLNVVSTNAAPDDRVCTDDTPIPVEAFHLLPYGPVEVTPPPDGVVMAFVLPDYPGGGFVPGTLQVWVDGVPQLPVETDSDLGTFAFDWAPTEGDVVTASWVVP